MVVGPNSTLVNEIELVDILDDVPHGKIGGRGVEGGGSVLMVKV